MSCNVPSTRTHEASFGEIFSVLSTSGKVKSKDYLDSGKIPIIDQGQRLIAGYANEGASVSDLPLTVFGDHTRSLKFVDFPFLPGADGTRLLVARDNYDRLYAHYLLENTTIPSLGYSRHMSVLKEITFKAHSSLEDQREIAACLSTWDRAIELHDKLIAFKEKQKQGLMQVLLTGKKRLLDDNGEPFSEVWENNNYLFEDVFDLKIGGTPSRSVDSYWAKDGVGLPWVSIANLNGENLYDTTEKITTEGAQKSNVKLIPKGTVIVSFKLSLGKKSRLMMDAYTNEAICALIVKDSLAVNADFVFYAIEHVDFESSVDQAVKGKTLNKAKLAKLAITLPCIGEQKKIAALLSVADSEISAIKRKCDLLKQQKQGLMQQLLG